MAYKPDSPNKYEGKQVIITSDRLLIWNLLIINGPKKREIDKAVIILKIDLNVIYSKTIKFWLMSLRKSNKYKNILQTPSF